MDDRVDRFELRLGLQRLAAWGEASTSETDDPFVQREARVSAKTKLAECALQAQEAGDE